MFILSFVFFSHVHFLGRVTTNSCPGIVVAHAPASDVCQQFYAQFSLLMSGSYYESLLRRRRDKLLS